MGRIPWCIAPRNQACWWPGHKSSYLLGSGKSIPSLNWTVITREILENAQQTTTKQYRSTLLSLLSLRPGNTEPPRDGAHCGCSGLLSFPSCCGKGVEGKKRQSSDRRARKENLGCWVSFSRQATLRAYWSLTKLCEKTLYSAFILSALKVGTLVGLKIEHGRSPVVFARSTGDQTNLNLDKIQMHHCGKGPPLWQRCRDLASTPFQNLPSAGVPTHHLD